MKPHNRERWNGVSNDDLLDLEEDLCQAIGELIDELRHIQKDANTAVRRAMQSSVCAELYSMEDFLREARQEIIFRGLW